MVKNLLIYSKMRLESHDCCIRVNILGGVNLGSKSKSKVVGWGLDYFAFNTLIFWD